MCPAGMWRPWCAAWARFRRRRPLRSSRRWRRRWMPRMRRGWCTGMSKPANMLLDARAGRPDHVYLSDFGLSKAWQGSTGLTGSGLSLGTLDYSAPEQIEGLAVDDRTDQYALGCAAFELLAGEPPFRRDQGLAVLYAQLSAAPPPLAQRRAGLPPAVDEVFTQALAKSPGERYGNCGEFADALRLALGLPAY